MPQVTTAALRFVVASERLAKCRRDEEQGDALVSEAWLGHPTHVLRLLTGGVDKEATGSEALTEYLQGETPLVAAIKGRSKTRSCLIVQLLLAAGANYEMDSADGHRPLMVAARKGNVACVKTLLTVGATVDAQNMHIPVSHGGGYTALHFAACRHWGVGSDAKRSRVVVALLEAGANKTLVDKCGKTALQLAKEGGYGQVAELLQGE